MCISSNIFFIQPHNYKLRIFTPKPIKRTRVRLLRLTSKKQKDGINVCKDMVMKNLKLYMKNMSIFEENEKLRSKVTLLHQENLALMSQFRNRFSNMCAAGVAVGVGSITNSLSI